MGPKRPVKKKENKAFYDSHEETKIQGEQVANRVNATRGILDPSYLIPIPWEWVL